MLAGAGSRVIARMRDLYDRLPGPSHNRELDGTIDVRHFSSKESVDGVHVNKLVSVTANRP